MIRFAIAEQQGLVRAALKSLLSHTIEFRCVGEAADGISAAALVKKVAPDILLLELDLSGCHGTELIRSLRADGLETRPVVFTTHTETSYIAETLRAGAAGYLLKTDTPEDLLRAMRQVAAGEHFISPQLRKTTFAAALDEKTTHDPLFDLTDREREVLKLVAEGASTREIAEKLFISPRTVESHRANFARKLRLEGQTDLVRFAIRRHIIPA